MNNIKYLLRRATSFRHSGETERNSMEDGAAGAERAVGFAQEKSAQ